MSRTSLAIIGAAVLVGFALAGGFVLIGANTGSSQKPQAGRPATSERAPEAENHSVGDLPAVEAASRQFLSGYLRVVYGKPGASIDKIHAASPQLLASLRAEGARVTPAQAQRTPHVVRVAVVSDSATIALSTAQIRDSSDPAYPLILHLEKSSGGWVVTRIGGP